MFLVYNDIVIFVNVRIFMTIHSAQWLVDNRKIDAFGIDHLDLQAEMNIIRPFTYTHRDSVRSYAHANQPLAHPLGANLREVVLKLRYQPIHKLVFDSQIGAVPQPQIGAWPRRGKQISQSWKNVTDSVTVTLSNEQESFHMVVIDEMDCA